MPLFDAELFYKWGGGKKYRCPDDEAIVAEEASSERKSPDGSDYVQIEKARADMVVREMRRVNSSWRPVFVVEKRPDQMQDAIPPFSY